MATAAFSKWVLPVGEDAEWPNRGPAEGISPTSTQQESMEGFMVMIGFLHESSSELLQVQLKTADAAKAFIGKSARGTSE